jgi:hypothetical protein
MHQQLKTTNTNNHKKKKTGQPTRCPKMHGRMVSLFLLSMAQEAQTEGLYDQLDLDYKISGYGCIVEGSSD